jgi:hypothetical protein
MYEKDESFAAAFENCTLPNHQFHHRDHLRLALIYLRRYGPHQARTQIAATILRYATFHGAAGKYHHTITMAWMRLLAGAAAAYPPETPLDNLFAAHPALLDKNTLNEYYSEALLNSPAARAEFAEPDLKPLPAYSVT